MDDLAALLAKFADAHGLSGYEDEVAALLREELEPLVDEVRIDAMGNVIGVRAGDGPDGDGGGAHGRDRPHGLAYRQRGLPARGAGRRVVRPDHPQPAGRRPHAPRQGHRRRGLPSPALMDAEDRKKMVKLKDMFIDCGATSAAKAEEMGVEIGSPVTIDRKLRRWATTSSPARPSTTAPAW